MSAWIIMRSVLYLLSVLSVHFCIAQEQIPLYVGEIPNSRKTTNEEIVSESETWGTLIRNVSIPTLAVYLLPESTSNTTAIIICPGGGYHTQLSTREGSDVAKALNEVGISAFVLKYRLPSDKTMISKSIGPLQDAQQAIRIVRQNAQKWNLNPRRIGIMGFSAGGHLAATAGTHFDSALVRNSDQVNIRPDFMILINPVISFTDSIGHIGSRNFLIGPDPIAGMIRYFSNELHITESTPPTFLVHSGADTVVPVENSLAFYEGLRRNKVPAELHIYAKGEHGFLTSPSYEEWFGRLVYWMKEAGLIP